MSLAQAAPSFGSMDALLAAVAQGKVSPDEASKQLAALQKSKPTRLYAKVSAKGAISVYGLQRMPVTLYKQQWERLFEFADDVKACIAANADKLSVK